ncbi:MAG: AI-2E family transporter [Azoarcus sp.]|jgi:predicted PurR-regulated permease PerM|nr:AI-2E family transporter [Azoarcus sp.]
MSLHRPTHFQTAAWAGVALALAVLLWLLAPILTPFVLAAVFAYLCNPAVNALERLRLPRPAAVLLVIAGLGLGLAALALLLLPMLYRDAVALAQKLPSLIVLFNESVSSMLDKRFSVQFQLDPAQFHAWLGQFRDSAQELLPVVLKQIGHSGMAIAAMVANLILIPVITFYLLQEWPRLITGLFRALPRPWLPHARRLTTGIDLVLAQFCRGQVSVMLLLSVYYSVGLWLVGLYFALPVGVLTGLLIFIPYAGFCGGLALALLTALLQGGGWEPFIGVAVVYGLGQLLESFALTPYLVGERIGLHPLAVIFALLAFGQLFGFVGVLIALPASAALLIGLRELASAWFASHLYQGSRAKSAPPSEAAEAASPEAAADTGDAA